MLILVDNYDSFTYNLYQLLGTITESEIKVVKNDELTADQLLNEQPEGVIFSPGPGRPEDAGNMQDQISKLRGRIPMLGVCLGHQAIANVYGGQIVNAGKLMHGKPDNITITRSSRLFHNCPSQFEGARYHSLIVDPMRLPEDLVVTAVTETGEIMALEDSRNEVYGLQFHPESIMTDLAVGRQLLANFCAITENSELKVN